MPTFSHSQIKNVPSKLKVEFGTHCNQLHGTLHREDGCEDGVTIFEEFVHKIVFLQSVMIQGHENGIDDDGQGDEEFHKWVKDEEGDYLEMAEKVCEIVAEFRSTFVCIIFLPTFLKSDQGKPQSHTQKMSIHRKQPSIIFCFSSSLNGILS